MVLSLFSLGVIAIGSLVLEQVYAHPKLPNRTVRAVEDIQRSGPDASVVDSTSSNCFPAIGFRMPETTPASLTNWWCSYDTEYAFVGFSYEVTACELSFFFVRKINVFMKFNMTIPIFRSEFEHTKKGFFEY